MASEPIYVVFNPDTNQAKVVRGYPERSDHPSLHGFQLLATFEEIELPGHLSGQDLAETLAESLKRMMDELPEMVRHAESEAARKVRTKGANPAIVAMVTHTIEASERVTRRN